MKDQQLLNFITRVIENYPGDWLRLTTHRLDIYNESQAKTQFLEQFEALYTADNVDEKTLKSLPTAYDYIRLGHPLSSVMEWMIGKLNGQPPQNVISFSSITTPVMAVLRKNLLENKKTLITYSATLPECFDVDVLKDIYGYQFELKQVEGAGVIPDFEGSIIYLSESDFSGEFNLSSAIDFSIQFMDQLGSVLVVNGEKNSGYISEIQHVRRRETIAMTPQDTLTALQKFTGLSSAQRQQNNRATNEAQVLETIKTITATQVKPLVGSSGLSMQYAIMMGLVHDAKVNHSDKAIKIIIPPNCYGGTNDQARRLAACIENVEVVDLPVDGGKDMVAGIDAVLADCAKQNAVPYIIVEIPTNPRVEVPNLEKLRVVLTKERHTVEGETAIDPVFILDQTFCPNVHFLGEGDWLSQVRSIAYVSGSKFPSGGLCTAGYCVANQKSADLMEKIELHLSICDNRATDLQVEILSNQMPSMNQRIADAYKNTREFVNFIEAQLPEAKINFVSEALAAQSFTPSVFSLDLPTKGETEEERETYKRALNLQLINRMIAEIPDESKFCVSYGQLKGCYWTIPATSTQGTTKEGDKDYIVRVSLAPDLDLARHKAVFENFVANI